VRQARIRESLGLIEKYYISYNHALAQEPLMSLSHSLIIGWESPGSALLLDYLRLVLKVPEKEKLSLLAGKLNLSPPCSPLYFLSLTFNKLHLYPRVLPWIL
jgi:hypothetical protein